jgi:hypothetical protein
MGRMGIRDKNEEKRDERGREVRKRKRKEE